MELSLANADVSGKWRLMGEIRTLVDFQMLSASILSKS